MSRKITLEIEIEITDEVFDDLKSRAGALWEELGNTPFPEPEHEARMREGFLTNGLREVLHRIVNEPAPVGDGEFTIVAGARDVEEAYTVHVRHTSTP